MTQRRKSLKIDREEEWIKDWIQAVINAGKMQPEALRLHRQRMMSNARKRFLWSTVAGLCHQTFEKGGVGDKNIKTWADTFPPVESISLN